MIIPSRLVDTPPCILDVDRIFASSECKVEVVPELCFQPAELSRLAYVIFTSGSTGKPKAVMIEHRSACNQIEVWSRVMGILSTDRISQLASISFDNHVTEVFSTMHIGATSVVIPDRVKKAGPDMLAWLARK